MSTDFIIFLIRGDFLERKFAVIGFPLVHTMSPFIHEKLFSLSKIEAFYTATEISPQDFLKSTDELKKLDGFNVTIPYKQEIVPFLDDLGGSALLYGAVNTVSVNGGKLIGHNTDADGFLSALELFAQDDFETALICGCGGAARTLAIALAKRGIKVSLAVRDTASKKALEIKEKIESFFGEKVNILNINKISGGFDLLVNCTPLGMYPNLDKSPLEKSALLGAKFVFDAVYNPKETLLIKYAKELSIPCGGGMEMLVLQAAKAHKLWYGAIFEKEDILSLVDAANEEMRRVFEK